MLDFPRMLHVRVKLPVVDRIHPQSDKFATVVENKATVDSKRNDSTDMYIKKLYYICKSVLGERLLFLVYELL